MNFCGDGTSWPLSFTNVFCSCNLSKDYIEILNNFLHGQTQMYAGGCIALCVCARIRKRCVCAIYCVRRQRASVCSRSLSSSSLTSVINSMLSVHTYCLHKPYIALEVNSAWPICDTLKIKKLYMDGDLLYESSFFSKTV